MLKRPYVQVCGIQAESNLISPTMEVRAISGIISAGKTNKL